MNYANTKTVKMPSRITASWKSECPAIVKDSTFKGAKDRSVISTLGQFRRMVKRNSGVVNQIVFLYIRMGQGALLGVYASPYVQLCL